MKLPRINKKILKQIFLGIYVSLIAFIGIYLFFGDQIYFLLKGSYLNVTESKHAAADSLTIGYAFKAQNLDPILFDPISRNYLIDIYEGLVLTDKNLKFEPGIAVSWGMIDPNTWEFRLRPNIQFHDGSLVTAEDVVKSILRARDDKKSQLRNFLNSIKSVDASSPDKIRIITNVPDPLLLNKLAVTFIYPGDYNNFESPMGTGPYKFVSNDGKQIVLQKFENYWEKERGFYKQLFLKYIEDRESRLNQLKTGELGILTNVPPLAVIPADSKYAKLEGVNPLNDNNIIIKSIPSLEVGFIIFNFGNPILKDKEMRLAISEAIDPQTFVDLAFGFARPASQFVSSGVFGFNPTIKRVEYNLADAKKKAGDLLDQSIEKNEITFDYPESLEAVGQYVQQQLKEMGIDVILNPLSDEDLQTKIISGNSDMYYLGWKCELGDAQDLFDSIIHSRDLKRNFGQFNAADYKNEKVDKMIENSRQNLDVKLRLADLQEVMRIVTEDDIVGIPLFESDTIFAYLKNIQFEPRVDGYMHADEVN